MRVAVPAGYLTSVRDGAFFGWPYAYWGPNVNAHAPVAHSGAVDCPDVLHHLGLQEDDTPAGKAVQEVLSLIYSRARLEINFRRNAP